MNGRVHIKVRRDSGSRGRILDGKYMVVIELLNKSSYEDDIYPKKFSRRRF